ncbi:DUF2812 domain-containing protein [Clostridium sp.]|uniref:DUF2812 domain-containing protein n=1 Tax=Clostridium sp. TaxID=1506 RepID=UPI001A3B6C0C|nr:DUF2812 domain-containing protein [Clostridium sp.]MBK5239716.1 DUF2812 domain-containing protein [Clostridium sp.]
MRNKDIKTTYFMYLPYECSALEEYLEKMAKKGWLLTSMKRGFFKFRKIEIKEIKYSVDVLDRVSIFDHKDSDVAVEYREYCKTAGWTYICEEGGTQVFCTEGDKEIISIHTDEEEKFEVVFKSSIKVVYVQMFLIIFFIYNIYRQLTNDTGFSIASNIGISSIILQFSVILMNIIVIINFFIWVIKAKSYLKKNKLMPFNSYKQLRRKNILMIAYNLIGFIILLVAIFDIPASSKPYIPIVLIVFIPAISISCIKKYIDRKKYSKDANIGIYIGSMIISLVVVNILGYVVLSHVDFDTVTNTKQSEAPTQKASLTFEDFGYEKNGDKNLDIKYDKSIVAQKTFYSCSNGGSFLSYTIFESKYPWLIKLDENRVVSRLNNNVYNYNLNLNLKLQMTDLPSNIRVYLEGGGGTKNYFVLVSEDKVIYFIKLANDISEEEFLNMAYKELF